jgi:hypothetical protein
MSRTEESRETKEKLESHYLKVDLRYFFIVLAVLALLLAGLAIWESKSHILAPFTSNLLAFLKVSF